MYVEVGEYKGASAEQQQGQGAAQGQTDLQQSAGGPVGGAGRALEGGAFGGRLEREQVSRPVQTGPARGLQVDSSSRNISGVPGARGSETRARPAADDSPT